MFGLIISGLTALGWAVAYVLIIRRGFLDKTYGVPMVALAGNIVWEFLFAFCIRAPGESMDMWKMINVVWFGRCSSMGSMKNGPPNTSFTAVS
jgi:hypothetical protein